MPRELLDFIMGRIESLPVLTPVTFRHEMATPSEGHGHATLVTMVRPRPRIRCLSLSTGVVFSPPHATCLATKLSYLNYRVTTPIHLDRSSLRIL
jgi:hypothetical protein